jgi:putative restriction endonuclease
MSSIYAPVHCKPWRDSNNEERLNGENGLLLTPTIDHLFDRGFISFEDSGALIVSPIAHVPSLNRMGVATDRIVNVGTFTEGQKQVSRLPSRVGSVAGAALKPGHSR